MTIKLANRTQAIKPSPTLAVTTRAQELRAAGHDIIGLGAGEPDFDTPKHIKEAAIKAIHDGFTKYTAVDGTPGLKQAILNKLTRDNQLAYEPSQILVSCGGKHSFFNLAQALLNPGDEVIIPAPYWVSYPDMALLAGGKPVIISAPEERQFKISAEQLAASITPQTKMVVFNSPSNPTGMAYTANEWQKLAEVLLAHPDIIIATDDMYEHILWRDEPFNNILNCCPDLYHRTIVLNGVSKAYSMTGWRIGYAAGPKELITAMKKIQSQSTSNPTSIAQVAAQAALDGPQDCVQTMVTAFKTRHDFVVKQLSGIQNVTCCETDGTFYSFPNLQTIIDQGINNQSFSNDIEFAEYLLNQTGVALVPGSAFGAPGHMRLSFATSMDKLEEALSRLKKILR